MEQARKQNLPVPDSIQNAPVLLPGLEFYYAAFLDLSTCRAVGMGEGPIPWDAIDRYAQRHGLDDDEYDAFFGLIRALDARYLQYKEKQYQKKAKR